ncbi:hypothetical protein DFH08DRAFT_945984 [Mycena albidolilacea]|uniref:Uncharacterized protein n=1 Tax=Mycena albidolilacea TaxID=1033008 RepID=A0AAD6YZ08_9AGAR|nr:hypothetical protein DFH08DRAFT_945984 [Mycena albidolilacea]
MLDYELEDKYYEPSPLAQQSQPSDPEDSLGKKQDDKHNSEAQKALVCDLPKLVEENLNSMSNESNLRTYESSVEKLRVEADSSKLEERTTERLQLAVEALAVGLNPEPQAIAMEAREADKLTVPELELEDTVMPFDQEFNNTGTSFGATKTESGSNDPEDASGGKGEDTISSRAWEASAAKFARKEAAQKERLGEMLNGATNALKSQEPDGKTQTDEVDPELAAVVAALSFAMFFDRQVEATHLRWGKLFAQKHAVVVAQRELEADSTKNPAERAEQKNKLELESQRLEGLMHELSSSGLGLSKKRSMRNEL